MCLSTISELYAEPTDTIWKVGYKVTQSGDRAYCYTYQFNVNGSVNIACGNFIEGPEVFGKQFYNIYYPAGFHIWLNVADAKCDAQSSNVVYKVLYRSIVAIGTNRIGAKLAACVVARELKFVELIFEKKRETFIGVLL